MSRTTPRPFVTFAGENYKAVAAADLAADEIERAVESPGVSAGRPTTIIVKRGRSALIAKASLCLSESETRAAYKRFGSKTWIRRLAASTAIPPRGEKLSPGA